MGLELTLGDVASQVGCLDHKDLTGVYVTTSVPAVVPVTCLHIISTDPDCIPVSDWFGLVGFVYGKSHLNVVSLNWVFIHIYTGSLLWFRIQISSGEIGPTYV